MSKQVKCPICHKAADEAVLAIEYQGELYGFCCPYCRERFLEEVEEHELEFIHSTAQKQSSDT